MKILEWPQFLEEPLPFGGKTSAITVGVFDGVHIGHKALIDRIVAHNSVPVVITFRQSHYKKDRSGKQEFFGDVQSFRQKMAKFEELGVSETIIVEFNESFRHMHGKDFFCKLLDHGRMNYLVVGSDFRCGYQLDTDALKLKEFTGLYSVPTDIIPRLTYRGRPISSSEVRSAIILGNLNDARAMLGRPYCLDLDGASVSHISGGIAYDTSGLGRVLPPPGRYHVVFAGESGDHGKQGEILVDKEKVSMEGNLSGIKPKFLEFIQ